MSMPLVPRETCITARLSCGHWVSLSGDQPPPSGFGRHRAPWPPRAEMTTNLTAICPLPACLCVRDIETQMTTDYLGKPIEL